MTRRHNGAAESDHYSVLNVSPEASPEEIIQAFRRQARLWHPDKRPGDAEASGQMQRIFEAYRILSNAEERAAFDRRRAQSPDAAFDRRQPEPPPAARSEPPSEGRPIKIRFIAPDSSGATPAGPIRRGGASRFQRRPPIIPGPVIRVRRRSD